MRLTYQERMQIKAEKEAEKKRIKEEKKKEKERIKKIERNKKSRQKRNKKGTVGNRQCQYYGEEFSSQRGRVAQAVKAKRRWRHVYLRDYRGDRQTPAYYL